jgi:hypothetical protein
LAGAEHTDLELTVAMISGTGQAVTHVVEEPRASDGMGLASEAWATRASFAAVWAEQAATRWVQERNAALAAPEPDAAQ